MKAGNGCQKLCRVRANTGHMPPCGCENKGHRVLWQRVTIHVRQYLHVSDARHPCSAPDFMIDTRVFLCRLCGSNVKLSTPPSDAHTTGRRERHSRKTPFRARAGLVSNLRRLDAPSPQRPGLCGCGMKTTRRSLAAKVADAQAHLRSISYPLSCVLAALASV